MKFLPSLFHATALMLLSVLSSPWATAQDFSKIAVLDYNVINRDYYKAKESRDKIEKMAADYRKEGDGRGASIKTLGESAQGLQKELENPALSEKVKKEKQDALRGKAEEFKIKQQEYVAWGNTVTKILQDQKQREDTALVAEIDRVVQQVCKNKYMLVFSKNQSGGPLVPGLLTYSDGIDDITAQVLGILNKDAPASAKKEEKK
jgi:Skp family chaperone for outer membrane proteins